MNNDRSSQAWGKLVAAARRERGIPDEAAPYGFATRVVALAWSADRRRPSLLERIALRAVGVACLLALASVAVNFLTVPAPVVAEESPVVVVDPLSVLLDV